MIVKLKNLTKNFQNGKKGIDIYHKMMYNIRVVKRKTK